MKGLKDQRLLKFVATMVSSYILLGIIPNTVAVEVPTKDEVAAHSRWSGYNENTFLSVAKSGLKDLLNRMNITEDNGKYKFSYELVLAEEKNVSHVNWEWAVDNLSEKSVCDVLTRVFIQGLSELEKGYDIVLPSIDGMLFMVPEAKDLIEKWKKDGEYGSKIEKMITPFAKDFFEKYKKLLSAGNVQKN